MTRDLTDQKGWGSSKAIRWYRYSIPYLYRGFYDTNFIKYDINMNFALEIA